METEHKFIEQRKIMRLVCYRAEKYETSIAAACPFKKTAIDETCKNCVWFKIVDESRRVKDAMQETVLDATKPMTFRLGNLPAPDKKLLEKI